MGEAVRIGFGELGARIERARQPAGRPQKGLAQAAGLLASCVGWIESGR